VAKRLLGAARAGLFALSPTDGEPALHLGVEDVAAAAGDGAVRVAERLGRGRAAGAPGRGRTAGGGELAARPRPAAARGALRRGTLAPMRASGNPGAEVGADEIAAAVAAEAPFMEALLCRLIEVPTTLGNEEPGRELMREAFREIGLEPTDMPLDGPMLRAHPAASPFSWEVSDKRNVVADWQAAGEGGRSLVLNGHIDVVAEASSLWRTAPYTPVREGDWIYGRGAGDMKAGLAVILGAVNGLRGLGLRPLAPV